MKLLLINYEYPPVGGGTANVMWNIARELSGVPDYLITKRSPLGKIVF